MADNPPIYQLPDELLEAIVSYLPPAATISCGYTSWRFNKITYEPLVWRRHCVQRWRFWHERHELEEKLALPPVQTKWRQLFNEREKKDQDALALFNAMLLTQQHRYSSMEKLAALGYDVKDLMLRLRDETADDADDVLARRFHANAVLGQMHRAKALDTWTRLQQRQMVRLEQVLGAYDMFVLSGSRGDMSQIERELDHLAECVRATDPSFDTFSTRKKAIETARYLRSQNRIGNLDEENYHALRNNFLSLALFDAPHTSLPLQSVAIYCAVARRLGVNAKPSNYPHHVHAVIESPPDFTLDGHRIPANLTYEDTYDPSADQPRTETMHMDPWRSHSEVPDSVLRTRLLQMGAHPNNHALHLSSTTTLEIALRTGRNIMTSVQDTRERQRGSTANPFLIQIPDVEASWYSMLWSMIILGGQDRAEAVMHRRRQCLPYLVEHFQAHFPEDLGLIERHLLHLFQGQPEFRYLTELVTAAREADGNMKAPNFRNVQRATTEAEAESPTERRASPGNLTRPTTSRVPPKFLVGTHLRHRRFGYEGFVVGWDLRCDAEPRWMDQMRVDELPRGRGQPFYNVVADDKSMRYVAEENIEEQVGGERPSESLMVLAGRWFKRWEVMGGVGRFVSNIREEYPDD